MSIARLEITLEHVAPAVMRRIEVPLTIPLADLHLVIQAAMPWWNCHLYEFRVRDMRWGLPGPDNGAFGSPVLPAEKSTLGDLIDATGARSFKYTYDFGDDWVHAIKIEKVFEPKTEASYPRLIDAEGRCPPEDVGGPWGYQDYLDAIADPHHESHEDVISWRGPGFDPTTVDSQAIEKDLAKLARKWGGKAARLPRKTRTPSVDG
ncbi:MAG: plasmid pRiA4b ORF-3 family protein [Hyphomicrobiaceae bacterium]|nr:plasmid pRiA4b ORF-3 family protein [Hyphomicrobiaceae bacterium]